MAYHSTWHAITPRTNFNTNNALYLCQTSPGALRWRAPTGLFSFELMELLVGTTLSHGHNFTTQHTSPSMHPQHWTQTQTCWFTYSNKAFTWTKSDPQTTGKKVSRSASCQMILYPNSRHISIFSSRKFNISSLPWMGLTWGSINWSDILKPPLQ